MLASHRARKGFTLVELLVTISILAILATVSVVSYTSFIKNSAIEADESLVKQLNSSNQPKGFKETLSGNEALRDNLIIELTVNNGIDIIDTFVFEEINNSETISTYITKNDIPNTQITITYKYLGFNGITVKVEKTLYLSQ